MRALPRCLGSLPLGSKSGSDLWIVWDGCDDHASTRHHFPRVLCVIACWLGAWLCWLFPARQASGLRGSLLRQEDFVLTSSIHTSTTFIFILYFSTGSSCSWERKWAACPSFCFYGIWNGWSDLEGPDRRGAKIRP